MDALHSWRLLDRCCPFLEVHGWMLFIHGGCCMDVVCSCKFLDACCSFLEVVGCLMLIPAVHSWKWLDACYHSYQSLAACCLFLELAECGLTYITTPLST